VFQVLVKTTAHMQGSYSFDLGDRETAAEFVKRSDVWWYTFPVDEDILDSFSWRRGGAWESLASAAGLPRGSCTQQGTGHTGSADLSTHAPPVAAADDEEDNGDDDRW
jgi:hypothetical protein